MLKNYWIVALRNIRRNKLFSLINILGLSIGISSALGIFLIVRYDFSFDRWEPGRDRIYRLVSEQRSEGEVGHTRGVPGPLGEAVGRLSGVEEMVAFHYYNVQKLVAPGVPLFDCAGICDVDLPGGEADRFLIDKGSGF